MFEALKRLFEDGSRKRSSAAEQQPLALTIAVLLVEIACIDHEFSPEEAAHVEDLLRARFSLDGQAARELLQEARRRRDESISFHPFVQRLNAALSREERYALLRELWAVALADGRVDKYEEHQIRKLAEWLHLPHVDFVRARHESRVAAGLE